MSYFPKKTAIRIPHMTRTLAFVYQHLAEDIS
jgi:hypothetical protein